MMIAAGCTSGAKSPEPVDQQTVPQALFVRVTRLQMPSDTSIAIDARGALERIEARQLVASRVGTRALTSEAAAALIAGASALPAVPQPSAPYEGDLYTIIDGNQRKLTTPEAIAPAELKMFVQQILTESETVQLEDNTDFYVSAEPVQQDRQQRLASRGTTAVDPAVLDASLAAVVDLALQAPYRLHRVDEAQFRALESALAGRESFVAERSATWNQVSLWSPPL